MLKSTFLLSCFFLVFNSFSQTEQDEAVNKAWQRIYNSDQSHRGPDEDAALDCENLNKSIQLIIKYGYPKRAVVGKAAGAPELTYIHAGDYHSSRKTFFIIEKGVNAGEIDADPYLNYFLNNLVEVKCGIFLSRREPSKAEINHYRTKLGFTVENLEIETGDNEYCPIPYSLPTDAEIKFELKSYWHYTFKGDYNKPNYIFYTRDGKWFVQRTEVTAELINNLSATKRFQFCRFLG